MSRISDAWWSLSDRARRGVFIGAGVVAVLALIGGFAAARGGGGGGGVAAPPTTVAPTTTAAPTPVPATTTTQPPSGFLAPLTGLRVPDEHLVKRPALAVKIDNLDMARESALPQVGLPKADIVFEEVVEGDITRLVAIFQSQPIDRVGPVRSARTTDLAILPQLGRPLLAWSGGNLGVTRAVRDTPAIIDEGFDAATSAYARDRGRRAPHNLFVDPNSIWGRAPADLPPPPPLFAYRLDGAPNPPTAASSAGVDLRWGGMSQAPASWRWDAGLQRYRRDQRGRPHIDADGTPIIAANVVVLVTEYGQSPADARSPEAHTVGSGEAFIFTNGTQIHGRWDRPEVAKPATLVDDAGAPIGLTPGNTWVELPMAGGVTPIA